MDQLPVEISQRIRHEARIAGLHDHRALDRDGRAPPPPALVAHDRRPGPTGLTALAVSGATGNVSWITGEPLILAGGVAVLAVGFGIYAIEKEVHLHRLSRLLVDERLLSNTMAKRLQMNTRCSTRARR